MTGWQHDKQRADAWTPAIRRALAEVFICDAPLERDQCENTDLLVLTVHPYTVACRVRDSLKYEARYPFDVTIRASRPGGNKTELAKIVDGWGDFMFYGFGNPDGSLSRWSILSLRRLRASMTRHPEWFAGVRARAKSNHDASSRFVTLDTRDAIVRQCIHQTSDGYFDQRADLDMRRMA